MSYQLLHPRSTGRELDQKDGTAETQLKHLNIRMQDPRQRCHSAHIIFLNTVENLL